VAARRSGGNGAAAEVVAKSARREFQAFVDENIRSLIEELWTLARSKKKAWVACPHCDRRSQVEVPDTLAAVKAISELVNQGYGRPQPEPPNAGGLTVIRRVVPAEQDAEFDRLVAEGVAAELAKRGIVDEQPEAGDGLAAA
jgi:hypothetical protein